MKIYCKILLILFIISVNIVFAQDTNIVKFFPLKVGNVWVYNVTSSVYQQCNRTYYQRIYIDSLVIINNRQYYKFNILQKHISGNGSCGFNYLYSGYYRVDSLNGNIYRQRYDSVCTYSLNEALFDSLKSRIRDTAKICTNGSSFMKILKDTLYTPVFSIQKQTKNFEGGNFFEYGFMGRYANDFGLIEYREYGMSLTTYASLKGCILNGVMHGDTNFYLVSINQLSADIPMSYNLSQNYPNPFNPVTNIKFDVPKSSYINLAIYDAVGKEVSVLLYENLQAGSYSVDWDATAYPSGVYFYKITAGDFIQTKKMVLIK